MLDVLWVDEQVVAVWKPGGVPSQSDPTGDPDLLSLLRAQLKDDAIQLVHRLDRPVSGVMVFGRTVETTRQLNEQFQQRRIAKVYWAVVEGRYDSGPLLHHTIAHDGKHHKARSASDQRAVSLAVKVIGLGDRYSLLEVLPNGGAFHQIRVQLSLAGHPIKGDVKYGARRGEKDRTISFQHPTTGTPVTLHADTPAGGIWEALQKVGGQ